ncbi:MAG TPA: InlB B-repeat-containing protein, partial [Acidimicrobiales bacterium]
MSSPAFAGGYHTVTLAENDSGSDPLFTLQTEDVPTNLTLFANLPQAFTNAGHTFLDWNTQALGNGTSYADGASYDFSAPIVLYAIWTNQYATVTFDENANFADPVSETQTSNSSSSLTSFTSLSPSFVNAGHTFVEWNTQPDGSGTAYLDRDSYNFSGPLLLYAIWQSNPVFSTIFDANSGTGTVSTISDPVGASVSIPSGSGLSKSGFSFNGWNTAANGSGTSYAAGASYVLNADQTFYAQWIGLPQTTVPTTKSQYIVTFAQLGGTVTPAFDEYVIGGPAIILPLPTLAGSSFAGWFTEPSGGVLVGNAGSTFVPSMSVTLYATWSTQQLIDLNFEGNGSGGLINSLSGASGTSVTLPAAASLERVGFLLTTWNTAADGSGT